MSDPPSHTRMRAAVAPEFRADRVSALRPECGRLVASLLSDIAYAEQPADIIGSLVKPAVYGLTSLLPGLPSSSQARFDGLTDVFRSRIAGADDKRRAGAEMLELCRTVVKRDLERDHRTLINNLRSRDVHTEDELASTVASLAVAGYDSTNSLIGLGLLALLADRRPVELFSAKALVQEMTRLLAVVPAVSGLLWVVVCWEVCRSMRAIMFMSALPP
ncbi:hypothetical protein ACFQO7_33985 [Catellatospora aurea]|uniref:Cytochrome P450 n=1 Tax=Catellatospora aurea TaxID=1337874 RepID=A0ABW2H6G8_9ACTN